MVDGIQGGSNFKPLKLKGTDKSVDLNKLEGMRLTEKNKSIFQGKVDTNGDGKIDANDTIDINGDGIISGKDEIEKLQQFLNKLGGRDHKTSAKDFHADAETNASAFEALNAFADQQIAANGNKVYEEKNGNTTTQIHPDGSKTETTNEDGTLTHTTYPKDSNKPSSKLESSTESTNYSEYTYDGDVTTTHKYNGFNNSGTLESITVSGQKESAPSVLGLPAEEVTTEATFKSEEDLQAGRPSSKTFKYDGMTTTIQYEYNSRGEIKASGQVSHDEFKTVYYKQGEDGTITEISEEDYNKTDAPVDKPSEEDVPVKNDKQEPYEVKRGDSLWKIAKKQLGSNPTATQIANFVDDIMKANPNLKWDSRHYNVMIHEGDKINLPTTEKAEEPKQPEKKDQPEETKKPVSGLTAEDWIKAAQNNDMAPSYLKPNMGLPSVNKPNQTVTPEQPQQYSLNNDSNVISYREQLDSLERELTQFESENHITRGQELPLEKRVRINGYSKYSGKVHSYNTLQTKLNNYTNAMNNWQDGEYSFEHNGVTVNAEKITLPNGQRAIKVGNKYYEPNLPYAAFPDFGKEIKQEE